MKSIGRRLGTFKAPRLLKLEWRVSREKALGRLNEEAGPVIFRVGISDMVHLPEGRSRFPPKPLDEYGIKRVAWVVVNEERSLRQGPLESRLTGEREDWTLDGRANHNLGETAR